LVIVLKVPNGTRGKLKLYLNPDKFLRGSKWLAKMTNAGTGTLDLPLPQQPSEHDTHA
jgi:hypothetical protein